ncbi:MAG TPA: aspartate kinase [Acidimicrobiales bacterium]|jgi:aspartate kinase|nr:aspartate kinase [Acidimicrobiales bacterium]
MTSKSLLVQKFGGTSVADPDRIRQVADHVARTRRHGDDVVVVVSAMGKETDELIRLASEVAKIRPGREMDMLITAGERKATALLCMALHDIGVPAESFTGSQAGFVTDTNHTNARILEIRPDRVRDSLDRGNVPVVGGAQGVSTDRDVTFLGRNGSDVTAVALAHALKADACELYTDVSGVFTADPRVVPTAQRMRQVSFDEMLEMCAAGCPKPAMRGAEFARNWRVRLHVRSSFTWEPGTWVVEEDPSMEQAIVSAVVHDTSEAKVTLGGVPDKPGIAARVFRALADADVNVDMIVQNVSDHGVTDISFTVPRDDLDSATRITGGLADEIGAAGVTTDSAIGKVSLVGAGMKTNPGVAAKMFETLALAGVNIEMISTSAIRISCVVAEPDIERAAQELHAAFDLEIPR